MEQTVDRLRRRARQCRRVASLLGNDSMTLELVEMAQDLEMTALAIEETAAVLGRVMMRDDAPAPDGDTPGPQAEPQ